MADDYNVGYGRPPKATQFKRGQSGNPNGRPKGPRTFESLIRAICNEKLKVNTPAGSKWITKMEAGMTQVVNKAASGDLKAFQTLLDILSKLPGFNDPPQLPVFHIRGVEAEDGRPKYRFDKDGNEQPREEFLKYGQT
jgi:hypothetical protein